MDPEDIKLIALALAAIATLVLLVAWLKLNAFVGLMLVSLLVGAGAVLLERSAPGPAGVRVPYTMLGLVRSIQDGIGATLGGIAAVLGLGTMLGKLLAESAGAEVLAGRFVAVFGRARLQWCIVALALTVGLSTWFAVGFLILLPIVVSLADETRQPFVRLVLPLLSCLSVMHGLMPPHPGPVVAIDALHANVGLVLLWGFVVGIPTAMVAGPLYAKYALARVDLAPPRAPRMPATAQALRRPGFGLTLFSILLPVLLMLLGAVSELVLPPGNSWRATAAFLGSPTIALTVAVAFALWSLGIRCGLSRPQLLKLTESSVAAVGMTILVVGGGGGFARVLRDSGVAEAIGRCAEQLQLSPLLYGWLVSAFIRVATGSSTVAITTASGLLVPVLAAHPELTPSHTALVIVAVGCGSLFLSHLNDAGFWIVKECLGLSVAQTFRTWSLCETIVGLIGLLLAALCYVAV